MDGYLAKPIDPRLMFAAVEEQAAADAATPARAANERRAVNRQELLDRLGGDEKLLVDVARIFLEDCPRQLDAIRQAIDAKLVDRVRAAAHALKGSAGNLSASALFEAARTLEHLAEQQEASAIRAAWQAVDAEAARVLAELSADFLEPSRGPTCVR
jgi:HPt (histidine-containing phosphotransfer) domain-containing protein